MMLKATLRVSLFRLACAEQCLISAEKKLSFLSNDDAIILDTVLEYAPACLCSVSTAYHVRGLASFDLSGFGGLKRLLHTSLEMKSTESAERMSEEVKDTEHLRQKLAEDDDFSELGPVQQGIEGTEFLEQSRGSATTDTSIRELGPNRKRKAAIPKLMTEKREPYLSTKGKRKVFSSSSPAKDNTVASQNNDLSSKSIELDPIANQDVPSSFQLQHRMPAVSTSGKNSDASLGPNLNGTYCRDINFENQDSRRREYGDGHIRGNGDVHHHIEVKNSFQRQPPHDGGAVTIRIKNINSKTADLAIHSMCSSYGTLVGIARLNEDAVDAIFQVKDAEDAESLIGKLNGTSIDGFQWSAGMQSGSSALAGTPSLGASKDQLASQIKDCTLRMKDHISDYRVCLEDLTTLLHSWVHLESQPLATKDKTARAAK